jgi:hypothetical protein
LSRIRIGTGLLLVAVGVGCAGEVSAGPYLMVALGTVGLLVGAVLVEQLVSAGRRRERQQHVPS